MDSKNSPQYKISRKAVEDLGKIWHYSLNKWSVNQANQYYFLIIQQIEYLAQNPESGKSISYIRPGYRVAKIKSHLICYKCNDKNLIEIIRVLHQMMDISSQLT